MTEDYVTSFSLDYMENDDSDVMPYQRQMVSYTECQTYLILIDVSGVPCPRSKPFCVGSTTAIGC